jgi:hypothetical protein
MENWDFAPEPLALLPGSQLELAPDPQLDFLWEC